MELEHIKSYCRQHIDLENTQRVLDLGCGDGRWCFALRDLLPTANIKGVDLNLEAITKAKTNAIGPYHDIDFSRQDVIELVRDEQNSGYDLIVASSALQYIDRNKFFRVCGRLLNPQGAVLVCNTHTIAYYLSRSLRHLMKLKLKTACYYLKPVVYTYWRNLISNRHEGEVFLGRKHLIRHAQKSGFKIEFMASLQDYEKTFLGCPIGRSFLARKI